MDVVEETAPLSRVNSPAADPVLVMREADPVGFPVPDCGATEMFTFTGVPCVICVVGLSVRVEVVGWKLTEPQLLTRFVTLTLPSPVARSYPAVVLNPESTPLASPAVFVTQLGVPVWQGVEIVPVVMS
jgi:hypothetical protein